MSFSIGGLSSGIDTAALVSSLMQAERIPQQKLKTQEQASLKAVASWNDLRTKMQAVQTASEALRTPAKALGSTVASSDDKTVKATVTSGAAPATYTVKVDQLATAQNRVKEAVGPLSMTVGAGRTELTATSASLRDTGLPGGASLVSFAGASAGVHKVEVTRATAPAAVYGTLVLPTAPTELTVDVDGGGPQRIALSGSYGGSQAAFLQELNDGFAAAGVAARATVVGGRLQIATTTEGAGRSLVVAGAAAEAMAVPSTKAVGQNALVVVDGKSEEVDPDSAGPVDLGDTGITIEASAGLRVGTSTSNVVVTDERTTLGDLQSLLNTTGSPLSVAIVAGATGNSLVLSSTATGVDGQVDVPAGGPLSVLRDFTSTREGNNARAFVNGVLVERSSNSFTEVLPGLTLDLQSRPTDELARTVTITVGRDATGTADRAKALVEAMNSFIAKVGVDTKYDVKSKTGGPLVGDGTPRALATTLFSKAASVAGSGDVGSLAQLGIETTRDGKFEFKADTLTKALAKGPDAVAKVLADFGDAIATFAKESAQTGSTITNRRDGAQSIADARQKQADAMDVRLAKIEKRYKATYAAMETALASLKSQGGALNAALSSFSNGS